MKVDEVPFTRVLSATEQQRNRNPQGQPLNEERIRSQPFCPIKSGHQPANDNSNKNERRPREPERADSVQTLPNMIFVQNEQTQTNWRTQAQTHQKLRIRRINVFILCHHPHQKGGRDHKQTDDEDREHQVAESIHTARSRDLGAMKVFRQVPRKD